MFERVVSGDGERGYRIGHDPIDEFLEVVAGSARPNTVQAYAHDLKVFFAVVPKEPEQVTSRDVMAFVTDQRRGRAGAENVVRITRCVGRVVGGDDQAASGCGLGAVWVSRRAGDAGVTANPVPHGLPTRSRCRDGSPSPGSPR